MRARVPLAAMLCMMAMSSDAFTFGAWGILDSAMQEPTPEQLAQITAALTMTNPAYPFKYPTTPPPPVIKVFCKADYALLTGSDYVPEGQTSTDGTEIAFDYEVVEAAHKAILASLLDHELIHVHNIGAGIDETDFNPNGTFNPVGLGNHGDTYAQMAFDLCVYICYLLEMTVPPPAVVTMLCEAFEFAAKAANGHYARGNTKNSDGSPKRANEDCPCCP